MSDARRLFGGWLLLAAPGRYALAFLLLSVTWISGLGLLAVSGWFLTATALAGAGLVATLNLYTPSGAIRGLAIARPLLRYFERLVSHDAVLRTLRDLRVRVFAGVLSTHWHRIDALHSADVQTRLSADVDTLDAVPLRIIGPLVAAIATLIVVTAILAGVGRTELAGIIVAQSLAIFGAAIVAARAGRKAGRAVVAARAREREAMLETLGDLPDLIGRGRSRHAFDGLAALDTERSRMRAWQDRIERVATLLTQTLTGFGALAVAVVALKVWQAGIISAPVAVALPLLALGLGEAFAALPGAFWRVAEANEAQARLMPLLLQGRSVPSTRVSAASGVIDRIEIERLEVGFANSVSLLRPITVTVDRGVPLVVTGPSGVGKSALLATLAGELAPVAGEIRLLQSSWSGEERQGDARSGDVRPAHDSKSTDDDEQPTDAPFWRSNDEDHDKHYAPFGFSLWPGERVPGFNVSHLSQDPVLPDMTIGDFLRLGRHAARPAPTADDGEESALLTDSHDDRCWKALAEVGLDDDLLRARVGLEERMGPGGRYLSGGQRARLALAAIVLQDRPLVLLDEPFAGLDDAMRERVIAGLMPFFSSRIVIIVSHEAAALPGAWTRLRVRGR
ncbi:MAG: amino acid ABC transporter ATP-binding/permease protein [Thioalkalivibrionaceae bacterium]